MKTKIKSEIKIVKYLMSMLLVALLISGCTNPIYTKNVENAYSQLKIGMTKNQLDELFGGFKFLKEQTVSKYPLDTTDKEMRLYLSHRPYNDLYPNDMFDKVDFNGNIKAFCYLIKKELNWPNGWFIDYIAIFYDSKKDEVIGWSKLRSGYHSREIHKIAKELGEKF